MRNTFLIISFFLIGCSAGRANTNPSPEEHKTKLVVNNSNYYGVTLYLCRDGVDCYHKLGQIMSIGEKETFNIPSSFITRPISVKIVVFASSELFMTNSVLLGRGDTAMLDVEHYLPHTSLYIMPRGGM